MFELVEEEDTVIETGTVTSEGLLRETPGRRGIIIGKLARNEKLEISERRSVGTYLWLLVAKGKKRGWVDARFVAINPVAAPVPDRVVVPGPFPPPPDVPAPEPVVIPQDSKRRVTPMEWALFISAVMILIGMALLIAQL